MPTEQNYEVAFIATPSDETLSPQAEQLLKRIKELEAENREMKEKIEKAVVFKEGFHTIMKKGKTWVVGGFENYTLNKKILSFEYEFPPAKRTKKYLSNNRYESYDEAKEYLDKYLALNKPE